MTARARSGTVASQRAVLLGAIVLTAAASWLYVVGAGARHVHHLHQDLPFAVLMWVAMMLGMMLPSAAPMFTTYLGVITRDGRRHWTPIAAFVTAYASLWIGVSAVAACVQQMGAAGMLSHVSIARPSTAFGALLIAAGAYQCSPLKHACLRRCRTPLGFLLTEWRPGTSGALTLGLIHGRDCIVCCWAMMALMFALGTMSLVWMAALTLLMLAEKCAPGGHLISRASGVMFVAWGVWLLV